MCQYYPLKSIGTVIVPNIVIIKNRHRVCGRFRLKNIMGYISLRMR
jgi:hypothetical protein